MRRFILSALSALVLVGCSATSPTPPTPPPAPVSTPVNAAQFLGEQFSKAGYTLTNTNEWEKGETTVTIIPDGANRAKVTVSFDRKSEGRVDCDNVQAIKSAYEAAIDSMSRMTTSRLVDNYGCRLSP